MFIDAPSVITVTAVLAGVVVLICLAGRLARLGGLARRPAGGRSLRVEDVLALDTRRRLHLVRCEGRRVLLLTGGAQDIVVGWVEAQEPDE